MGHRTVIVVDGGGPIPATARALLPEGAPVVAADGGVDAAHALGLRVDVAVGDFDSVTAAGLARAESGGARIERHPADKDATDLALALAAAAELTDEEIVVVGAGGGRLDHALAGLLALTDHRLAGRRVRAHVGEATVHVVHGPGDVHLDAAAGTTVTLVPVGGDAVGVRTRGLRYPLHGETLEAGTTRGVSNVVADDGASVALDGGALLVVIP
jgi:thiamine pyrophosphokinase